MANEVTWTESTWKEINDAVLMEVGKVRTAQKVFPTVRLDNNPTQIPDEVIDFTNLSIREGQTKSFVEISATFTLTSTQVKQEPEQGTGMTLGLMGAKVVALGEDTYIFQLTADGPRDPDHPPRPANAQIENWEFARDWGLLRPPTPPNAGNSDPTTRPVGTLEVKRVFQNANNAQNVNDAQWGTNTFARVAEAISLLVGKAQAPPYALFLPTEAYADTFIPPSRDSLVTTADRIKPLVDRN